MNTSSGTADDELKQLEIEFKREEIRQLKSKVKFQWITPTSIAVLLPLIGAAFLYVVKEVKEYSDAHLALRKVDVLETKLDELNKQKHELTLEIPALLDLKSHYADEAKALKLSADRLEKIVEERQQKVDQLYLRGKYAAQEGIYALDHARKTKNFDRNESSALEKQIADTARGTSDKVSALVQSYHFYQDMSDVTNKVLQEFLSLLEKISPSKEALSLGWHPEGLFLSGRAIMATADNTNRRYYDVNLGRYLNETEVAEIGN